VGDTVRIGVIGGGGWLGGATAKSILVAKITSSKALTLSYRRERPARCQGVYWTRDNQELVNRSDMVIVSVRPGIGRPLKFLPAKSSSYPLWPASR
jgi:pyrroline-5-carboxylate reductase